MLFGKMNEDVRKCNKNAWGKTSTHSGQNKHIIRHRRYLVGGLFRAFCSMGQIPKLAGAHTAPLLVRCSRTVHRGLSRRTARHVSRGAWPVASIGGVRASLRTWSQGMYSVALRAHCTDAGVLEFLLTPHVCHSRTERHLSLASPI